MGFTVVVVVATGDARATHLVVCVSHCFLMERRGKNSEENSNMALSNFLRVHFITRRYVITKEAIRRGFSSRRVQKALRTRTANRLVEDSRFRGGSANIRDDRARAPIPRLCNRTALGRPRASTSNSPSDLARPQTNTHLRDIDRMHAQRDIRGYGDDHIEPPQRQSSNPTALRRLRPSI